MRKRNLPSFATDSLNKKGGYNSPLMDLHPWGWDRLLATPPVGLRIPLHELTDLPDQEDNDNNGDRH